MHRVLVFCSVMSPKPKNTSFHKGIAHVSLQAQLPEAVRHGSLSPAVTGADDMAERRMRW